MGQEAGDVAPELGEEVNKSVSWSAHAGPSRCRVTAVLRGEERLLLPLVSLRVFGRTAVWSLNMISGKCR